MSSLDVIAGVNAVDNGGQAVSASPHMVKAEIESVTQIRRNEDAAGTSSAPGRLTPQHIVEVGIEITDREGLEAVTMRRLGDELGVDPTAVYRHFRDKDDLMIAIADRLLGRAIDGYAASESWRTDLTDIAARVRRVYLDHPALAHVLSTSPAPLPNNQRLSEAALEALSSAGLGPDRTALAFQVLENYAAGASALDAEVGSDADATWRASFAALPASEYPNLVALAPRIYRDDEAAFSFGLDLILDGLARMARRSSSQGARS